MPLYEYQCKQCGHRFEKIQGFSAPDETECPKCHGELERLISAPALQFKGSGFYLTDYGKAGSTAGSRGDIAGGPSSGSTDGKSASSGDSAGATKSGESGSTSSASSPAASTSSGSGSSSNSGSASGSGGGSASGGSTP